MSVLQPVSMVFAYPHAPLNVITTQWLRFVKSIREPYRPERHYMRGPLAKVVRRTPESS